MPRLQRSILLGELHLDIVRIGGRVRFADKKKDRRYVMPARCVSMSASCRRRQGCPSSLLTRRKRSFKCSEEESRNHHSSPNLCRRLQCPADAPAQHAECGPHVGWYSFVHQCQWFEYNVGYVEYCEEPFVAVRIEVEIVCQACNSGIPESTSAT